MLSCDYGSMFLSAIGIGKRNPVVSSLAAGLVTALVGGLAGVTWQWYRAEAHADSEAIMRQDAVQARQTAEKAWQTAEDARKEAA